MGDTSCNVGCWSSLWGAHVHGAFDDAVVEAAWDAVVLGMDDAAAAVVAAVDDEGDEGDESDEGDGKDEGDANAVVDDVEEGDSDPRELANIAAVAAAHAFVD